jgi:protocatechuate 3,4-dioxygenase alpha subunit
MRTPSQTVGPYYEIGLCRRSANELAPGERGMQLTGRLLDGVDTPVADGLIELWDPRSRRWGRCGTDAEGRFSFRVDGDAPYVEAYVFARGLLRHQLTRIYLAVEPDDPALATLAAEAENGALRFDIRLQGERQTVFFEH